VSNYEATNISLFYLEFRFLDNSYFK